MTPSKLLLDWITLAERGAPERTWLYWEPSTSTWNVGYGVNLGKDFGKISKTWGLGTSESWLKRNVGKCPPKPYQAPSLSLAKSQCEAKLQLMYKQMAIDISAWPQAWQDLTLDLLWQYGPTVLRSTHYIASCLGKDWKLAAREALGFRNVAGKPNRGLQLRRSQLTRWASAGILPEAPWSTHAFDQGWSVEGGMPK